ncbi:hypothetical protein Gorai_005261 [Gossypium raimondii]|uniref:Uncharacterized protein n=1 Tax=Gossypium raimondii TaxID=29730 RepID=A0A7J8QD42_GOSRA|nr:hypothetical protein [Gossypium raimondii]
MKWHILVIWRWPLMKEKLLWEGGTFLFHGEE